MKLPRCKTVNFHVASKICAARESAFNFLPTCSCHSMLYLFCSLNAPNAFLIPCRSQWRTTFSPNVQERFFPIPQCPPRLYLRFSGDHVLHLVLHVHFYFIFIYTYNDILNNAEAINVEVMMRMLQILWKETERKRVVEN